MLDYYTYVAANNLSTRTYSDREVINIRWSLLQNKSEGRANIQQVRST